MKKIILLVVVMLLLAGCTFEDICIEGENITYDGTAGSGKLKITQCKDSNVVKLDPIKIEVDSSYQDWNNDSINFNITKVN